MMDHLCKQNDKWNWTCRCCYARTGHDERNNHSHTMNGGQLRPILCLSRLKLQRGINFHHPASFQLRNVCVCGFNSILSCAFLLSIFRSEIFVLMTQIRLQFPSFTIDECELSCAVCACCLIAMCFFFASMLLQYLYFFFCRFKCIRKKKLLNF